MIYTLFVFDQWMNFALRIAVAVIFLAHGWPKLKNFNDAVNNFTVAGLRSGKLLGTLVALLETVGGVMLLLGIGAQIISLLFATEMIFSVIWKIRRGEKMIGGYELDLVLLAASLILATSGGGILSLDRGFRIW